MANHNKGSVPRRFPGDPRFGIPLSLTQDDLTELHENKMLSTRLLDFLIQRGAPHCTPSSSLTGATAEDPWHCKNDVYVGSLSTQYYIKRANDLFSSVGVPAKPNNRQHLKKIAKIQSTVKAFSTATTSSKIVIPLIFDQHFFVIVIQLSGSLSQGFYDSIVCYDSLRHSTRISKLHPGRSSISNFIADFHQYVLNFILVDDSLRQQVTLPSNVQFHPCPGQSNCVDCGLFAVGVVLHIIDGIPIDASIFDQVCISRLRTELSNHLSVVTRLRKYPLPSFVIRKCFSRLKALDDLDSRDNITAVIIPSQSPSSRSTSSSGGHNQNESLLPQELSRLMNSLSRLQTIDDNNSDNIIVSIIPAGSHSTTTKKQRDDPQHSSRRMSTRQTPLAHRPCPQTSSIVASSVPTQKQSATNSPHTVKDAEEEADTMVSDDTAFESILKEFNTGAEYFSSLDDVEPFIDIYQQRTGNRLAIRRSEKDKFRVYQCVEHLNCCFKIQVGRRRADGLYSIKKSLYKHNGRRCPSRASDGRRWKQRRAGKLEGIIVHVANVKKDKPAPADVVKTAAMLKGEVVPYFAAYRALNAESGISKDQARKGFQLIIPYLDKIQKTNPGSVVGYTCNADNCLMEMFIVPGFMNRILQYVRPVISLDAAHLKSVYKGTIYIASVLSGANEVYPIGFLISCDNENKETWSTFLTKLHEACPIISQEKNNIYPFIFISDRDKGLKPALAAVFPRNVDVHCAKHIESNVRQKYGAQCAAYVIRIAKTFSTRQQEWYTEQVRKIKPAAATYLEEIDGLWKNTSWLEDDASLPPRYGIVTSNTAESINNMLLDARNMPSWLDATEKIIDVITTRIASNRRKHIASPPGRIVAQVAQVIKIQWDKAASLDVFDLEQGSGKYKVTEHYSQAEVIQSEADITNPTNNSNSNVDDIRPPQMAYLGRQSRTHIVIPDKQWCSCGLWQDLEYPCQHFVAFFRKWRECDSLETLQQFHVSAYYMYDSLHNLYTPNINPVVVDAISYDRKTKPPVITQRRTGRPKVKRYRRRSELVEPSLSKITCSQCGEKGHNVRTCKNATRPAAFHSPL